MILMIVRTPLFVKVQKLPGTYPPLKFSDNEKTVLLQLSFVYSLRKMAMTVMLSRTPHRGISSIAHFTTSFVADRPSLRARNAISHAARGLMTSQSPSEASNTSLSVEERRGSYKTKKEKAKYKTIESAGYFYFIGFEFG